MEGVKAVSRDFLAQYKKLKDFSYKQGISNFSKGVKLTLPASINNSSMLELTINIQINPFGVILDTLRIK
jgi:hypothetical protein